MKRQDIQCIGWPISSYLPTQSTDGCRVNPQPGLRVTPGRAALGAVSCLASACWGFLENRVEIRHTTGMAKAASETSKSGGKRRKSAAANGRRFEDDTLEAMRLVKASLTKLVKAISPDLARPIDLQKRLQLDSKLCWQVFNILRDKTMLASAQHVPSMTSLKRLFAGAMKQGVSPELVEAVTGAVNEFNYVVDSHAPDRPAFDSMVAAATAGDSDSRTDLWHRRNAFRSESHIWGVQVETFISVVFIRPSADGQGKDECTLSVRLGHRRLRPSATIVVHRSSTGVATEFLPASSALPLDPGANATFHAPLLPEFCSRDRKSVV